MQPLLLYLLSSSVKKIKALGVLPRQPSDSNYSFSCEMKFDGFGKNMLQTKAAYIAWLSLSISHWSLSKNKANTHVANLN